MRAKKPRCPTCRQSYSLEPGPEGETIGEHRRKARKGEVVGERCEAVGKTPLMAPLGRARQRALDKRLRPKAPPGSGIYSFCDGETDGEHCKKMVEGCSPNGALCDVCGWKFVRCTEHAMFDLTAKIAEHKRMPWCHPRQGIPGAL